MAELKVLDLDGLDYLTDKIAEKYVKKDGNKVLSTNDYTTAEKNKLSGIPSGAQVNVLEGVKVNGTDLPIASKKVNIDLSAYALKSEITTVMRYKGTVASVNALPSSASVGDVYNVTANGANYAWSGSEWDQLGASVDLSGYYTKGQVDSAIDTATDDMATNASVDSKIDTVNDAIALKANSADVYTKGQVDTSLSGKVPTTRTINGKTLSSDVTLAPADLGMSVITNAEIDTLFTA